MDPVLGRYLSSLRAAGVRRVPRGLAGGASGTGTGTGTEAETEAEAGTETEARIGTEAEAVPGRRKLPPELTAALFGEDAESEQPVALLPRPERPANPDAVLAAIAEEVDGCRRCRLCEHRAHAVPGEGSARPDVVFVGEGPGADEDRTGRPFVGRAGRLLDDIITKGMRLARADVFICNVVKCRPPQNRVPGPDETVACRGYLERQLAALAPKVICTLGATAAHVLLDTNLSMGRLRRTAGHVWREIPVIPTYHPAYLLRSPEAKKPTWEDIQRVMEIAAGT